MSLQDDDDAVAGIAEVQRLGGHTVGEGALENASASSRLWQPQSRDRAGLLAWADALYLVDGKGQVHRSGSAGRRWANVGAIGGQPPAFASAGRDLFVALHDGKVKRSTDGGRSWRVRVSG